MRRQLPPLNALKAFEAAARHLSISLAANELCVTPAAISHQVRLLEDHIGLSVFERSGRRLVLTDAGQAGLDFIRDGFAKFNAAMDAIDSLGEVGVLSVSVAPSFAGKWLLPRLDSFHEQHPDIDVHVSASMQLTDFAKDGIDIAIRYGPGRYPDLVSEKLLNETVTPVLSPSLLLSSGTPRSAADLASFALLHDDSPENDPSCPDWSMWLKAAGASDVDARGVRASTRRAWSSKRRARPRRGARQIRRLPRPISRRGAWSRSPLVAAGRLLLLSRRTARQTQPAQGLLLHRLVAGTIGRKP